MASADFPTRSRTLSRRLEVVYRCPAQQLTKISGRGVGMDVVLNKIKGISGTINISSQVDQGTTFKLKIPLTLNIVPALIITSNGDRYAIPQTSLLELVRLEGESAKKAVEMFHDIPIYRLRDHLLPLIYLKDVLQSEVNQFHRYPLATPWLENSNLKGQSHDFDILNIVVLQAGNQSFGLVVDTIPCRVPKLRFKIKHRSRLGYL